MPALFAARMTSPTKDCGRLAPRLPWLIRPGRTRKSSSRIVMAQNRPVLPGDGAWSFDFLSEIVESASTVGDPCDQSSNATNDIGPAWRPAFSLAIHGWPHLSSPLSDLQQLSTACGGMRFRSLQVAPRFIVGETDPPHGARAPRDEQLMERSSQMSGAHTLQIACRRTCCPLAPRRAEPAAKQRLVWRGKRHHQLVRARAAM
jgi:hypothetical protein